METQLPLSPPAIFAFILFLFIIWISKGKKSKPKLPPGPRKLPLIGNIHLLGALPHRSLAKLAQKYGPVMHIQLGQLPTTVVSSPEMAKEVMKTHDIILANRPRILAVEVVNYGNKGVIFSSYGAHWRQMRKICTLELFTGKRVESFRSIREEEVSNIVKEIRLNEGSVMNLSEKIHSLAYGITSRAALGKKSKDQEAYMEIMKDVVEVASGFSVADMFPSIKVLQFLNGFRRKLEKLHHETDKIIEKIVRDHKDGNLRTRAGSEHREEDLVDVLLKLQKQSDLQLSLSDEAVKATLIEIYTAGSDTSLTVMEWAMSELVKNPRVMEKVQAEVRSAFDANGYVDEACVHELKYLKSIIKETLRLHPPLPLLLPRECYERCEINGYEIPAKSKVIVNAWATGRDPNYWTEAERFYPERFLDTSFDYKGADFQFTPFGSGRRICPGISFGMAVVELSLANLLFHFDWKMPDGKKPGELDMDEFFGLSVKRKHDLHLIPIAYRSSGH